MKLSDWSTLTGILGTHPTTEYGAVSVIVDVKHPDRWQLWTLDDYAVSSCCGVVVWLVPRTLRHTCGRNNDACDACFAELQKMFD